MSKKQIMLAIMMLMAVVVIVSLLGVLGKNDAKTVSNLSPEFVLLDEAINSYDGVVRYVFWESQISILDSKDKCIYQTNVNNDSFIVKYKGDYYIRESIFHELIAETVP